MKSKQKADATKPADKPKKAVSVQLHGDDQSRIEALCAGMDPSPSFSAMGRYLFLVGLTATEAKAKRKGKAS